MIETTSDPAGGITVVEEAGSTVARLWGDIDEALREQASAALLRALDRELPVILDASDVQFIDSTGIAFLIQFCRIGREEGLTVTLRNPPELVTDVLAMLGLERMFDQVTDAEGAPARSGLSTDSTPASGSPAGSATLAPALETPTAGTSS